ncbi:MAG TPA: UvrD-helicase domain-containing protein, partial [Solirubrobacteraceae bacterium]|nr:UvrD-helicase domain-containing protein [Solirubrobacteraceae bacterium]
MSPTLLGPAGRAFTCEQSEAIRAREGSLLLEANAGSGKTSVLVERFVRSVLEDGVRPGRILAITFTERAAGELRARVRERFVELGRRDEARETESAWVSTIHGFCARVLRAHAIAAGLDPAFAVLDEAAARALRDRAWDEALGAWLDGKHGPAALEVVAAYDTDRLRRMIAAAHDALRSDGQTQPRLPPPPDVPAPAALRAQLHAAAAVAAAELAGAGEGRRVAEARARLDRCREALGGDEPEPLLGDMTVGSGAGALKSAACDSYRAALKAYENACRDRRAAAAVTLLDELLALYATAYAEA